MSAKLYDLTESRVLEVVADRTTESATAWLSTLPEQQRNEVAAVAMELWRPFMTAVEANLPGLKVARASPIKETFLDLWAYLYAKSARKFFKTWCWWATHSRLKPLIKGAKRLKKHLDNIMTYLKHRISNAAAEGFNSKIQTIKSAARGFRNFENYRVSILFHGGKLDLYPQASQ